MREVSANAILVQLDARPDFAAVSAMPRGPERKTAAWDALVATAEASQQPMLALVDSLTGAGLVEDVQRLVSPNMLVVTPKLGRGNEVVASFQRDGVDAIWSNGGGIPVWTPGRSSAGDVRLHVPTLPDEPRERGGDQPRPTAPTWGVDAVGAPQAWAQGADGAGMVFGSIDTGVDGGHEALRAAFRGTSALGVGTSDHNWIDLSRAHAATPFDTDGHGTHTTGTAVGRGGIGVAPAAKWIAVRQAPTVDTDGVLQALQWMQAPTRVDGSAPDPTKAPDVVGMSWRHGIVGDHLFAQPFENLQAAGIELVKSAGNDGPVEETITSPGHMPQVITVGGVDEAAVPDPESSHGPTLGPDGDSLNKPELAAPGIAVLSAMPGNTYGALSGTSMAQPHVAGAALILLGKFPQLTHKQLVGALQAGAIDLAAPGWDTASGAGLLNIPAALHKAAELLATDTSVAA